MTYTYKCLDCGKQFDINKKITEELEIRCIECNSSSVKRIFVPIGTVVNCDGFCGKINK